MWFTNTNCQSEIVLLSVGYSQEGLLVKMVGEYIFPGLISNITGNWHLIIPGLQ